MSCEVLMMKLLKGSIYLFIFWCGIHRRREKKAYTVVNIVAHFQFSFSAAFKVDIIT